MKITNDLLKTIAAGLILGATMTSCEKSEPLILSEHVCEDNCELDHLHKIDIKTLGSKVDTSENCPACGLG